MILTKTCRSNTKKNSMWKVKIRKKK